MRIFHTTVFCALILLACTFVHADEGVNKETAKYELSKIVSLVDTRAQGIPVLVFNPTSWERTDAIEITTPYLGVAGHFAVCDQHGKYFPAKSIGDKLYFTAHNVPALGYKLFYLHKMAKPVDTTVKVDSHTMENEYFRVDIPRGRAAIIEMFDKKAKRHIFSRNVSSSVMYLTTREMDGETVVRKKTRRFDGFTEVVMMDYGPSRAVIVFDRNYKDSHFVQEFVLYEGVRRMDVKLTIDWNEEPDKASECRKLSLLFDLALPTPVKQMVSYSDIGRTVFLPDFCSVGTGKYNICFTTDAYATYELEKNKLWMTVLESCNGGGPENENGVYEFTYSVIPTGQDDDYMLAKKHAFELNYPLQAVVCERHEGKLPPSQSFATATGNGSIAVCERADEKGTLLFRAQSLSKGEGGITFTTHSPYSRVNHLEMSGGLVSRPEETKDGVFSTSISDYATQWFSLSLESSASDDGETAPVSISASSAD